jgi:hypothetical protein
MLRRRGSDSARRARHTSNPLRPGMFQSSRRRSGLSVRAISNAAFPSLADNTRKPSGRSVIVRRRTMSGSSSTSKMVTDAAPTPLAMAAFGLRAARGAAAFRSASSTVCPSAAAKTSSLPTAARRRQASSS